MERLEQLREIYGAYIEKTEQLQKNRKLWQGVFGFGGRLSDDPCHTDFALQVEAFATRAAEDISPEAAHAVVKFMLKTPEEYKHNELAYWMLLAVQGRAGLLAGKLKAESASELLAWYEKQYPKRMRLPVQKDLVKQLKTAAK